MFSGADRLEGCLARCTGAQGKRWTACGDPGGEVSRDAREDTWGEVVNQRVLRWLDSVGLPLESIARGDGEDVPMVKVDGERNLWTIHYMLWVQARWRDWAKQLGYENQEKAQSAGHLADEFDS